REWSQAVRRTGSVGDNRVRLRIVLVFVNAHNDRDVFVRSRCGDDNFLRAAFQVKLSFFLRREDTRGFNDDLYAVLTPRQVARIALSEYFDFYAVNDQGAFLRFYRSVKLAMRRVVFKKVCQR